MHAPRIPLYRSRGGSSDRPPEYELVGEKCSQCGHVPEAFSTRAMQALLESIDRYPRFQSRLTRGSHNGHVHTLARSIDELTDRLDEDAR